MDEYSTKADEKKIRKKTRALIAISLIGMYLFGFFLGYRIAVSRNIIVSASNTDDKSQEQLNSERESGSNLAKINAEDKTVSPGEYKPWSNKRSDGKKVAYLTFDDGPSTNTNKILDILKKNNIKATFFLIGKNAETNKELVKREVSEGNVVGNHTYNHQLNYREGPEAFVQDLNKCDTVLKSIIGSDYKLKLVRFPGGSFGQKLAPFRAAVTKAGYHYINWNDLTGDAEHNNVPVNRLLGELEKYTSDDTVVILMHDAASKTTSVQALPQVIQYLKSKGYTFDTLK